MNCKAIHYRVETLDKNENIIEMKYFRTQEDMFIHVYNTPGIKLVEEIPVG